MATHVVFHIEPVAPFASLPGSLLSIITVRPAYSLPNEIWPLTGITTALALAKELFPGLGIASGPRPWLIKSLVVRPKLQIACF